MLIHRTDPLNCETPVADLGESVTPIAHFYVRNHFQVPAIDAGAWKLDVAGLVGRRLALSLRELIRLPSETRTVTLECAGNGRRYLSPAVGGEPWGRGAVSTAEWTGVPLAVVLDLAGVLPMATDVVFRGADRGTVDGGASEISFERGLSLEAALDGAVLLSYAMNGEALPVQHGFPVRVIVPGWYGVASVKWLSAIELTDHPFAGYYQATKYRYESDETSEPVTLQRVKSLITEPVDGAELPRGETIIRGIAWSGAAPIARVEVSIGRDGWRDACLVGERRRHSWQRWEAIADLGRTGNIEIRARATDLAGHTQPEAASWNRYGYGNNAVHAVSVSVVGAKTLRI
ncbi:sulfite oxidase [Sinomonas sp. ASV322]|uniref:sulfite oxidase n=1 Tax=Sinomonas sp. ASV322 TaxID=3041920 RepID=UPI0027DDF5A8|nr:sulfite oxidase [Sinomonas sp. ASV322]MDQ4501460.1 sulfite oxidase [Sinomonas sp. ASV322]